MQLNGVETDADRALCSTDEGVANALHLGEAHVEGQRPIGAERKRRRSNGLPSILTRSERLAPLPWSPGGGFSASMSELNAELGGTVSPGVGDYAGKRSFAIIGITTTMLGAEFLSARARVALLALVSVVDLGSHVMGWMLRIAGDYYEPPRAVGALLSEHVPLRVYSRANWQRIREPQPPLPVGIRPWIIRNGLLPEKKLPMDRWEEFVLDVAASKLDREATTRHLRKLLTSLRSRRR